MPIIGLDDESDGKFISIDSNDIKDGSLLTKGLVVSTSGNDNQPENVFNQPTILLQLRKSGKCGNVGR